MGSWRCNSDDDVTECCDFGTLELVFLVSIFMARERSMANRGRRNGKSTPVFCAVLDFVTRLTRTTLGRNGLGLHQDTLG
jgi:hypothetical protein